MLEYTSTVDTDRSLLSPLLVRYLARQTHRTLSLTPVTPNVSCQVPDETFAWPEMDPVASALVPKVIPLLAVADTTNCAKILSI